MKKIILFITYFFTCYFSISQNKTIVDINSQVKTFDIISKVLDIADIKNPEVQYRTDQIRRKIEGGHRTGIYNGYSELNFILFSNKNSTSYGTIKLRVNSSIYVNGFFKKQEGEYSELTNFKFINSGGLYGTKIITADWDGYSAKFTMKITDDNEGKDEVYISIKGESNWQDYARISMNETQLQELVNMLSITKIPQNVVKQKEIKVINEKIRLEKEEQKTKQEKIKEEEKEKIKLKEEEQEKIRKENAPKDNKDYLRIIGKPIKIGNLEVAEYDFPESMSWNEANKACRELGKNWRLPSKSEFYILKKYFKNKVFLFFDFNDYYWSSSKCGINCFSAYAFSEYKTTWINTTEDDGCTLRAVRTR